MRVAFFGSPEFAAASLRALLLSKHGVVGVITQPDRAAGRGLKLEPPPVKTLAAEHQIPVHQPEKLNQESTFAFLNSVKPDILVVVAFSGFLGAKLLSYCKTPPINVHPSMLPDLRGAAPMQWAVIRGYSKTGVTTQFMVKEMDAGDVLLQIPALIDLNESYLDVHNRLKAVGGDLLVKTLDQLEAGSLQAIPQNSAHVTFAPLLKKDDGKIAWAKSPALTVHNQVRGLYPWPSAYTWHQGKRVKILKTLVSNLSKNSLQPGSLKVDHQEIVWVGCADSALQILELQPEGKRAMPAVDFYRGLQSHISKDQLFQFQETLP